MSTRVTGDTSVCHSQMSFFISTLSKGQKEEEKDDFRVQEQDMMDILRNQLSRYPTKVLECDRWCYDVSCLIASKVFRLLLLLLCLSTTATLLTVSIK